MSAATLTPARQEMLVDAAGALAERLRQVRVTFTDGQPADVGLPRNCLGKVEGLLRRARDLDEFRATLDLLHQLDPIEAQNADHPKDQYKTLRDELLRFMDAHRDRALDDWLFVLGWVRRLLPANGRGQAAGSRATRDDGPRDTRRRDAPRRDVPPSLARAPEPPPPARPVKVGERVWKDVALALDRGRVVARKGRDQSAEDTSNAVPEAVVKRVRKGERVVADVVVVPGFGTALRIAEVKNVR
jgi:hypothetical protein